MEIRVTRYAETTLVAVSVAREGHDLPEDVRIVDEATAAGVEELVRVRGDDLRGMDLDALIGAIPRARS